MYSIDQINELKQSVKIVEYLEVRGIKPQQKKANEILYFSPISGERGTPSFSVNILENVFNCFSSGEKGDVIKLSMLMENKTFVESVKSLQGFNPELSVDYVSPIASLQDSDNKSVIKRTCSIKSPSLIKYLKSRGISLKLANLWLVEIHYYNDKGDFYALGFKNDNGGYSVRSEKFKGVVGKNGITTIKAKYKKLVIFEGFFDFLSWLELRKEIVPTFDVIITNSASQVNQIETLGDYFDILCFFDNDKPGLKAVEKVKEMYSDLGYHSFNVFNYMCHFPKHKDLNEYLKSLTVQGNDQTPKDKKRVI